eukprot:s4511_g4.t1
MQVHKRATLDQAMGRKGRRQAWTAALRVVVRGRLYVEVEKLTLLCRPGAALGDPRRCVLLVSACAPLIVAVSSCLVFCLLSGSVPLDFGILFMHVDPPRHLLPSFVLRLGHALDVEHVLYSCFKAFAPHAVLASPSCFLWSPPLPACALPPGLVSCVSRAAVCLGCWVVAVAAAVVRVRLLRLGVRLCGRGCCWVVGGRSLLVVCIGCWSWAALWIHRCIGCMVLGCGTGEGAVLSSLWRRQRGLHSVVAVVAVWE